jgi:hypothetical protein
MHPTRTRLALSLAGVATLAALTGCSGGASDGDSAAGVPAADEKAAGGLEAPADEPQRDMSYADAAKDSTNLAVTGDPAQTADDIEPGRAVISTGSVSLESDDVGRTRFDVRKVLDRHRGTISEQETTTGDGGEVATARLVARVPSKEFGAALDDLEGVATLLSSNESGQDVTTKVIDVAARVRAQRASVARIEALLDRATDLQEVISIERQLATRQAELDSLVSRQKYLADQTAMSTISISIEQPAEEAKHEEEKAGFLGGLEDGWDSFVAGGAAALAVVGFLVPWLILVAVLGLPLWLVLRRRAGRRPSTPTPATP